MLVSSQLKVKQREEKSTEEIKQWRCVGRWQQRKKREQRKKDTTKTEEGVWSQSDTTYKGPLHVFLKSNYPLLVSHDLSLTETHTHNIPKLPQTRCHLASSRHLIACWGQQFSAPSLPCGVLISAFPNRMWLLVFVRDTLLFAQKRAVKELSECFSNTDGTRNIYPHFQERVRFDKFKYMKKNGKDIQSFVQLRAQVQIFKHTTSFLNNSLSEVYVTLICSDLQ